MVLFCFGGFSALSFKKKHCCVSVYIFPLNMCVRTVNFSDFLKFVASRSAEVVGLRCVDNVYLCFLVFCQCAFTISIPWFLKWDPAINVKHCL